MVNGAFQGLQIWIYSVFSQIKKHYKLKISTILLISFMVYEVFYRIWFTQDSVSLNRLHFKALCRIKIENETANLFFQHL